MSGQPIRVLFVCTGNSCRSVMAQGLLAHRLKQLESRLRTPVDVSSAGVFAIEGMSASRETLRLLAHEGVDVSGHMARGLTDEMIKRADWIFVMEQYHLDEIIRRVPEATPRLHLLKTYGLGVQAAAAGEPNIPDPIGKPPEVYESCLAMIREAIERVIHMLLARATH